MKISELIDNLEPDLFSRVKDILLALAGDADVPPELKQDLDEKDEKGQ